MRDIKFRAWHKEVSEYLDGSICNMFKWIEDGQPVVLEQFTGLRDRNGVEIYEGDVIHDPDSDYDEYLIGQVVFSDYGKWVIREHDGFEQDVCEWSSSCVICGNIHQNPELLK